MDYRIEVRPAGGRAWKWAIFADFSLRPVDEGTSIGSMAKAHEHANQARVRLIQANVAESQAKQR